jgi:hypothetical protein
MKPDEAALLDAVKKIRHLPVEARPSVRELGQQLGIAPKRVCYLCEKWTLQGIYNYGVSCDLGWLEEDVTRG